MKREPLESQLFAWKDWDGDHECMVYYNPVLKVQIGKHPVGTKFDHATILFDKGILQLENHGEFDDKGHADIAYCAKYTLNLTIEGTIQE